MMQFLRTKPELPCLKSGIVRVRADLKDGKWILSSPDIDGFFMSGADYERLEADVPNVIQALMKANYDLSVEVKLGLPAKQLGTDSVSNVPARKQTDKMEEVWLVAA